MPIAKLRPTSIALANDMPAQEVPENLWTGADNVGFRDIYPERVRGWRGIYDANAVIANPMHVRNIVRRQDSFWMYAGPSLIGVTDKAGTHTDITPSGPPSGQSPSDYSSCELNGVPVINWPNINGPIYWDLNTANPCLHLPGWIDGENCNVIRSHRNYLMALNISGANDWPSVVRWSDSAEPGSIPQEWAAAPDNDAGALTIGDTGTGIIDGMTLRDQFLVYKQHSIYIMQFIGGNAIFGVRPYLTTIGALASNCIVEWRGNHLWLADGDVMMSDGNQARSIVDNQTRRHIFANLDQEYYANSFVVHNRNRNEIWFCYPENGSQYANRVLTWDCSSGSVQFSDLSQPPGLLSRRTSELGGAGLPHADMGNVSETPTTDSWDYESVLTWDAESALRWNEYFTQEANDGLVGSSWSEQKLALLDTEELNESGDIIAYLRRDSLDFGDPSSYKLARRVWPRITGVQGDLINIRVGAQDAPDDPIEWQPFRSYIIGRDKYIDTFCRGRYLSFEFGSTNGSVWRLTGFDVDIIEDGLF